MIGIIDYGSGNLRSVYNAFKFIGQEVKICERPEDMKDIKKLVLPGVGSSGDALRGLTSRGLVEPILSKIKSGMPFLGICLGLQMLFERSSESGGCECLGLIKGDVKLFKPADKALKVPQIGWNTVLLKKKECPVFLGIKDESYFYFVHSYYCDTKDPGCVAGETDYGTRYVSAVWKENVYAVQFHPERSQKNGLRILENFSKL